MSWQLVGGRPVIEVFLVSRGRARHTRRTLLADTGAGSAVSRMDLILSAADRRLFSTGREGAILLGGAFTGRHPTFWVQVSIPPLAFASPCVAVAVPSAQFPAHLEGIACFRFLNRFTYGNLAGPDQFALETP